MAPSSMISITVYSTLVALIVSALAVSATPSLSLKVTGPDSVDGVENLKIVTTVTNTGDETLRLLNDPHSALSKFPTNTFTISHNISGVSPTFIGAKVKYMTSRAAKSTKETSFTILAPGESVATEHDLSSAYNFTIPGAGKYIVEASNLFHYVDQTTSEPIALWADEADAHMAAVSGKLAVARPNGSLVKRESYVGCSASEESSIVSAVSAASNYASNAYSYLSSHTSTTTRYTTWFGTYTSSRHSTALSHFTNLRNNDYTSFTYDCTCDEADTYAFVYPDTFGTIHLCPVFWEAPTTGTDSKGGTLIHESSHFTKNGGTEDYVYGQSGAKSLAQSDPSEAVFNADSHEYFAENNPSLA